MHYRRSILLLGALGLAACAEAPVMPTPNLAELTAAPGISSIQGSKSYVVIARKGLLPAELGAAIANAGGSLTSAMNAIGVASASSDDPDFAAKASRALDADVMEDVVLNFPMPRVADMAVEETSVQSTSEPTLGQSAVFGASETFRAVQWAPDAISAPAAWDLGYRGRGARVAILDGGIYSAHLDIAPNLDVAHSRSFVAGQPFNSDARVVNGTCGAPDTFWHGTHVAGIVAAPSINNLGTVGIAPEATIIGVKVLHCGSGSFGAIINGIVYAATPIGEGGAGANIINMSLGAIIPRGPFIDAAGNHVPGSAVAQLLVALSRATSYANKRNVTVIAAMGNNGLDMDHSADLMSVPAQSNGVIAVSATSPRGWAFGPTNLDVPTTYTNFGQSAVGFAGPGGDSTVAIVANCTKPRFPAGTVGAPCWVFDMVMAPVRGSGASIGTYSWAAGTSMASPAVAGVAALIVGKYNGNISPAGVERILRQSANDLGKPGNDDFFGGGRVNALRAVQ